MKITVGDGEWEISSADGFKSLLNALDINWICRDGRNVIDFESLVDGGTYTLGPPRQQQQQQQQPLPPQNLGQMINLNTESIYNGWSNGVFDDVLPTTETDLRNAVQKELPVALPAASQTWVSGADVPCQDVVLAREEASAIVLSSDLESIRSAIFDGAYVGTTEDATHGPIDALIARPIAKLCLRCGCAVQTNRNGTDSSGATLKNLRPDLLLWLPSGILAFKGEDKAFGVPIQNAREDLRIKMNVFSDTFFGTLPYQLAYACAGSQVEFVAFMRTNTQRPREVQLTNSVDLSTVLGRSLCVRYAINIARLLVALNQANPGGNVVRLGQTVTTATSRILIGGEYVTKKTKYYTAEGVIAALYNTIRSSRIPHLVYPTAEPIFRAGVLTVNLQPVGFCDVRPESVEECKKACRELLTALHLLHHYNYVHRDIRQVNVMRASGSWYMIDLEWADYNDSEPGDYHPALQPPEFTTAGFRWTSSADMWQFGILLQSWDQLDEPGHNLVRLLTNSAPEQRPSAADTLRHAFLEPLNHGS